MADEGDAAVPVAADEGAVDGVGGGDEAPAVAVADDPVATDPTGDAAADDAAEATAGTEHRWDIMARRDSTWRDSTHNLMIGDCECIMDFGQDDDGAGVIQCSSMDGHGYCSARMGPVPEELWELLFDGLEEGDSRKLEGNDYEAAVEGLRGVVSNHVPDRWRDAFAHYKLC